MVKIFSLSEGLSLFSIIFPRIETLKVCKTFSFGGSTVSLSHEM